MVAGVPEPPDHYLAYCKANGNLRTALLTRPDVHTASNALTRVFESPAWKALKWEDEGLGWRYTLHEEAAKQHLWEQISNMANKTVQRTEASRSTTEINPTSSAAGSGR